VLVAGTTNTRARESLVQSAWVVGRGPSHALLNDAFDPRDNDGGPSISGVAPRASEAARFGGVLLALFFAPEHSEPSDWLVHSDAMDASTSAIALRTTGSSSPSLSPPSLLVLEVSESVDRVAFARLGRPRNTRGRADVSATIGGWLGATIFFVFSFTKPSSDWSFTASDTRRTPSPMLSAGRCKNELNISFPCSAHKCGFMWPVLHARYGCAARVRGVQEATDHLGRAL